MIYNVYSDDSIKVIVRVRPPDQHITSELESSLCLEVHDARTILMHTKPEHRVFTFDHVAGMDTTQVMNVITSVQMYLKWV